MRSLPFSRYAVTCLLYGHKPPPLQCCQKHSKLSLCQPKLQLRWRLRCPWDLTEKLENDKLFLGFHLSSLPPVRLRFVYTPVAAMAPSLLSPRGWQWQCLSSNNYSCPTVRNCSNALLTASHQLHVSQGHPKAIICWFLSCLPPTHSSTHSKTTLQIVPHICYRFSPKPNIQKPHPISMEFHALLRIPVFVFVKTHVLPD